MAAQVVQAEEELEEVAFEDGDGDGDEAGADLHVDSVNAAHDSGRPHAAGDAGVSCVEESRQTEPLCASLPPWSAAALLERALLASGMKPVGLQETLWCTVPRCRQMLRWADH